MRLSPGGWKFIAALVVAGAVTACGKKGPPLAPFTLIPGAVELAAPRRIAQDVFVQVTVPAANMDGSKPAAMSRIDVYGVTSVRAPSRARFLEIATLVATIPVAPAGEPGDREPVLPDPKLGALQGSSVVIQDTLSPEELLPRELPILDPPQRVRAAAPGVPLTEQATLPSRFYMAFGFNARNRPGPPSNVVSIELTILPPAPGDLRVTERPGEITLQWDPSGGLFGWLLDRPVPPESSPLPPAIAATLPASAPSADWSPEPTAYNVYVEVGGDPLALPGALPPPQWGAAAPALPLNPKPVPGLAYTDVVPADEIVRCYYVRALRGSVESAPSARRCVTPVDIEPPVAPTGLQAFAGEGAITLLWEPNVEEDLGGFIVLRRDAAGDTLLPLTSAPISETRFIDRTVTPGMRYTYVVQAVDNRLPLPNVSAPAEVSETAR